MATYPIDFTFKIATLSNDFIAKDADGRVLSYVRQKMFKLVDEISVFTDDSKAKLQYTIKANKWMDWSATYSFITADGKDIGRVARKGWASIWKARYEIFDEAQKQDLLIQEENAWVKVGDALLSEIPILGLLTGYLFNPSYIVTRPDGTLVARLKKQRSLVGRRFRVSKESEFEAGEEERILLGLMMMIILERRRG
jgi:hypothetical protein